MILDCGTAGALAALLVCIPYSAEGTPGLDLVRSESGLVSGAGNNGVRVFKGIPYAAPPIRSLRWREPQAPPHWNGVREALQFGAPCPQPVLLKMPEHSEDCLTLNVWTPAIKGSARLPVMVIIHGGGFLGGWSGMPAYDGAAPLTTSSVGKLAGHLWPSFSRQTGVSSAGRFESSAYRSALAWHRTCLAC